MSDDRGPGAADRLVLSAPTRQAPVAVVFIAARFVRNIGLAQLAVLVVVVATGTVPEALLGFGLVVAVAGLAITVAAWWRFVFHIEGDELVVSKGIVAHERLTIPLDRIQSVSINQGFVNRLIGLVSVAVDTAGSAEAEFELDAVERGRAEALQRLAAGHARLIGLAPPLGSPGPLTEVPAEVADPPPPPGLGFPPAPPPDLLPSTGPPPVVSPSTGPPPVVSPGDGPWAGSGAAVSEETIVTRSPAELARIGLARWPWAGLAALAPLIAFADEAGELLPIDIDQEALLEDNLPEQFGRDLVTAVLVLALAALIAGAVLGVILQVVRVVVTEWDLRLTRTSTGFRRTAGLFSTTSRASTLSRVQAIQTDETPMQRLFGIRHLKLPTIGHGDLDIPGTTASEMTRIRDEVFDGAPRPPLDRRISHRFIFLEVRNAAIVGSAAVAAAVTMVRWWGLLVLAMVPLRWMTARRQWRLRRWGIGPDRIIESYELVNRHTAEIELIKAQTVEVRRSFFERRRGLATVRIRTAEGFLAVPLIPLSEAEAVRDLVLFTVESNRQAWM